MISSCNKIDKFKDSKSKKKHHDDWIEDITSQNKRRKKPSNHQIHQKIIEIEDK